MTLNSIIKSSAKTYPNTLMHEGLLIKSPAGDLATLPYDLRTYHLSIRVFKARIKMLRKALIIPDMTYDRLVAAFNILASRSIQELNLQNTSYHSINQYIIGQVENLTDKQTTEFLSICYSHHEHHSTALKLWVRSGVETISHRLKSTTSYLLNLAEKNLKIVMPGQIHGNNIQPTSFGYYLIEYAATIYRACYRFERLHIPLEEMPTCSGGMAGTSLSINANTMARTLKFSSVKFNAADSFADHDFIMEFHGAAAIYAANVLQIVKQLQTWAQQSHSFITLDEKMIYPQVDLSNSMALFRYDEPKSGILDRLASLCTALCSEMNTSLELAKSAQCPLSHDYESATNNLFKCYDLLSETIDLLHSLFPAITVNKRSMKEAIQGPQAFFHDIRDWLLRHTTLGLHRSIEVAHSIVNLAIRTQQKPGLLELEELQAIEPRIDAGIYTVLSPSRAVTSRKSTDGSSPIKMRRNIKMLRRRMLLDSHLTAEEERLSIAAISDVQQSGTGIIKEQESKILN